MNVRSARTMTLSSICKRSCVLFRASPHRSMPHAPQAKCPSPSRAGGVQSFTSPGGLQFAWRGAVLSALLLCGAESLVSSLAGDPVPLAARRRIEGIRGEPGLALGQPEAPDRGLHDERLLGQGERE